MKHIVNNDISAYHDAYRTLTVTMELTARAFFALFVFSLLSVIAIAGR